MGDDAEFYMEQQENPGGIRSLPHCPKCGQYDVKALDKSPVMTCRKCGHTETFKSFEDAQDGWCEFV